MTVQFQQLKSGTLSRGFPRRSYSRIYRSSTKAPILWYLVVCCGPCGPCNSPGLDLVGSSSTIPEWCSQILRLVPYGISCIRHGHNQKAYKLDRELFMVQQQSPEMAGWDIREAPCSLFLRSYPRSWVRSSFGAMPSGPVARYLSHLFIQYIIYWKIYIATFMGGSMPSYSPSMNCKSS